MSLATRRKALPQSRCMLPGSWWHTDWQISNFEVWFKLLQAAASWARHPLNSHFSEKKLYPQSRVAVSGTECRLGRPPPSSRTERKVQHGTTSWTSLQWVCNPLTLKPQALSHQLCLSQGLDMSTDQHHPQSSTIILFLRAKQLHSDGWYSCCLHLANVTVQNRELLCTSCTNMHESHDTTQIPLQILEQWWYVMMLWVIPSGNLLHSYDGKSPCLTGKSTISIGPWLQ